MESLFKSLSIILLLFSLYAFICLLDPRPTWHYSAPKPLPLNKSFLFQSKPERPKKLKTMVVTSWRSGSTLIGELLNSYPKSFYTYEPLTLAGIRRVYDGDTLANASINIMEGILGCQFESVIKEYEKKEMSFVRAAGGEMITRNQFLKRECRDKSRRNERCGNPQFLNSKCKESDFHVTKTVRLGLDLAAKLLENPRINQGLKIIYIGRDPRGLLNSRLEREWCVGEPRCIDPGHICQDLEKDYHEAQKLKSTHSDKILVIRYEEFAMDIWNKSKELFDFMGVDMTKESHEFLITHTNEKLFKDTPKVWNTFRDPKKAPFHWKERLTAQDVFDVQKACQKAMSLWGYRMLQDKNKLLDLDPLEK